MRNSIIFWPTLGFFLLITSNLSTYAMENQCATPEVAAPTPKTSTELRFPVSFYDEAWVGADYRISAKPAKLAKTVIEATSNDSTVAEDRKKKPNVEKKILDWIYAIKGIEKVLLKKSFSLWNVSDIELIARMLTRLNLKKPGRYRTMLLVLPYDENEALSKEELEALIGKETHTAAERELLSSKYRFFLPDEEGVRSFSNQLQAALKVCQQDVAEYNVKTNALEKLTGIATAASLFAYQIARHAPFEVPYEDTGINEDIARMAMNTILVQCGLTTLSFSNRAMYRKALFGSIKENAHRPFWLHITEVLAAQAQKAALDTMAAAALAADMKVAFLDADPNNSAAFEESLRKIMNEGMEEAMPQEFVLERPTAAAEQSAKPLIQQAKKRFCAQCCKKERNNRLLMQCTQCKTIYYCDSMCQSRHWNKHKLTCTAK